MVNQLAAVTPKLLAQGLMALRENAVMPRIVNRQYDQMAGERGSTIDVPIPSAIAVKDVVAANIAPDPGDLAPTTVPIVLDRWKEAAFFMTDQDILEAMNGTMPMQASEAIKAVANEVDQYLLSLFNKFYGFVGTPGTPPFADEKTTDATLIRGALNRQLAPLDSRSIVLDPDAEANALGVRAFQDMSWNGSAEGIRDGRINQKLGFGWFMDQNVQSHIAGTAAGYTGDAALAGDTVVTMAAGSGGFLAGDIIDFAGHAQTYVVTADQGVPSAGVAIQPGLVISLAGGEAVTVQTDHVMNGAFHRDAIALAMRPLSASRHPGVIIQSAVDPVSGMALRLEVSREHKRDRFSFDVLYGAEVVRRELGARLAG